MMLNRLAPELLGVALLAVASWPIALSAAGDDPSTQITRQVGNKVRVYVPAATRPLPLESNRIRLVPVGSSAARVVPVALTETRYNVTNREVDSSGTAMTLSGSHVYYYELASASPSTSYTWGIWTSQPFTGFKLFAQGKDNHMAWISQRYVEIAEISKPRTKQAALDAFMNESPRRVGVEYVDVGRLAGEKPFAGTSAFFLDIRIQSVYRDKLGRLTLTVKGSQSDKLFTFVHEGSGWRKE